MGFLVLVNVRPGLGVKRSGREHLDRAVALFRDHFKLWPLAAVWVALSLGEKVFMWIVGAFLSLPIWALFGLGLAVLALVWISVGTSNVKRGVALGLAWLFMMAPVALLIWWQMSR